MFEELIHKKLVIVTGKGGIGKSLTAASIAQYAASSGKRVCIVQSTFRDQVGPLFGYDGLTHELKELAPSIWGMNLNSQLNFRDFVVLHLGFGKLFEKVFTKPLVRSFINMLPGVSELTLLGRLFYMCELDPKEKFDLIIFDGYASGHILSLLKTPDAVLHSGLVGPIVEETKKLKAFLQKDDVSLALVTVPEPLIISEAIDFAKKFKRDLSINLSHIVVNKCLTISGPGPESVNSQELALRYLQEKCDNELTQIETLSSELSKLIDHKWKPKVCHLPDLGAIDEPFAANFAQEWFALGREVELNGC